MTIPIRKPWRVAGKPLFLLVAMFLVTVYIAYAACDAGADPLAINGPAPHFAVESGAGQIITSEMLRGKIVVMFYEKRAFVKRNSEAKDTLNKIYDEQPHAVKDLIARLPVIDCSGVIWPISEIWKKSLRDNSRRVGMTVYCDWTGDISRSFDMNNTDSNMLMLDGKGLIRYRSAGKIDTRRLAEIEEVLALLVDEEGKPARN